jgi:hypothetical protein
MYTFFCTSLMAALHVPGRFVADQMNVGIKSYQGWEDLGGEKLIKLKVGGYPSLLILGLQAATPRAQF